MRHKRHSIHSLMTTPELVACRITNSYRLIRSMKMKRERALPLWTESALATIIAESKIFRKVLEGNSPWLSNLRTNLLFPLNLRNLKSRKLTSQQSTYYIDTLSLKLIQRSRGSNLWQSVLILTLLMPSDSWIATDQVKSHFRIWFRLSKMR